jgi:hypothetical protein
MTERVNLKLFHGQISRSALNSHRLSLDHASHIGNKLSTIMTESRESNFLAIRSAPGLCGVNSFLQAIIFLADHDNVPRQALALIEELQKLLSDLGRVCKI